MRKLLALLFLLCSFTLLAQKTGTWRDHFAYTQGVELMPMQSQLVCATSAGLIFFDGEINKVSKVNGLSDFDITAALYDAATQRILLGYGNGNIDLINSTDASVIKQGAKTVNLNDWKESRKPGGKRINRFLKVDSKYFVATASRILEVSNSEITADFTIDETGDTLAVRDLALFGSTIVAATAKGLYTIDKNNAQLYYYGSWQRVLSGSNIISIAVNGNTFYALRSDGALLSSTDLQTFSTEATYANPRVLSVSNGSLWLSTSSTLYNVTTQQSISNYGSGYAAFSPYRACQVGTNPVTYIADLELGLMGEGSGGFGQLIPNGPQQNQVVALDEFKGKIIAAGGGSLSVLADKREWVSTMSSQISGAQEAKVGKQNVAEFFVSTSSGVARFSQDGSAVNYVDKSLSGVNIRALDFDRSANLFGFASNNTTPVKIRTTDGTWTSLSNSELNNESLGKVTSTGKIFWGIFEANQLYVYSAGSDVATPSDDQASVFGLQSFTVGNIYSIAADRNNQIWLGTDKGVFLYDTNSDPFTKTPTEQRVKIPNEIPGRASYLLEYEKVTALTVDGGNRKWFGTRDAGAFLQSPDGHDEVHAFGIDNSPLPSNNVVDIAVNSVTGEVIFATDKGMVGFYGEATTGRESFSNVKIFPNPVRPEMQQVTIANLMEDASVRITDMSGNLVFYGTASGGTITWNTRNLNGNRVASGVYLIFFADSSGEETQVEKLLVMN